MKKEFSNRVEYHNEQGQRHREDGPAVEWLNGDKQWYQNGLLHRLDGPAIELKNGNKFWYQNDKLHRLDGPACEYVYEKKCWYYNGKLHREDGPAIEYDNGDKEYYLYGIMQQSEKKDNKTSEQNTSEQNTSEQKIIKKEFSDRVEYRNEHYQLHRLDGPAIEYKDGSKEWYQNNQRHRLDGPAAEYANGGKFWYQNDQLHRLDGPATEWADGTKEWYQNNDLHRLDGPAKEYEDGSKEWFQNGLRHRLDGPAMEMADGSKEWYQNGLRHRLDGPAFESEDEEKQYWIKGQHISEDVFQKFIKNEILTCKKCGKISKKKICNSCSDNKRVSNPANVKVWTKLFLSLGYTVLHDPGMSILHHNEPFQGAALASMAIDIIDVFENPLSVRRKIEKPIVLKQNIKSETLEKIINHAVENNQWSIFKNKIDFSRLNRETIFKIIDSDIFKQTCQTQSSIWVGNFSSVTDPEVTLKLFNYICKIKNSDDNLWLNYIFDNFELIQNLISNDDLKLIIKLRQNKEIIEEFIKRVGIANAVNYCIKEEINIYKLRKSNFKKQIINYYLEHNLSDKLLGMEYLISFLETPLAVQLFQKHKQSIIENEKLELFLKKLPTTILNQLLIEAPSYEIKITDSILNKKHSLQHKLYHASDFTDFNLKDLYYEDDKIIERATVLNIPLKEYIKYLSPQGLIKVEAHLSSEKKIRGYAAEHLDPKDLHLLARDKSPWIRSIVARRCPLDMLSLFKGDKHQVIREVIRNRLASFSPQIVKTAQETQKEKEINKVADILLEYAEEPYHYIHFTENYSLRGLNPGYKYGNPIGIYGYPLDHKIVSDFRKNTIPYGSDRKFFILFKARNPETVLDFKEYQMSQLYYDCHKIVSLFKISEDEMLNLIEDSEFLALNNSPGGRFYYITMMVASKLK